MKICDINKFHAEIRTNLLDDENAPPTEDLPL